MGCHSPLLRCLESVEVGKGSTGLGIRPGQPETVAVVVRTACRTAVEGHGAVGNCFDVAVKKGDIDGIVVSEDHTGSSGSFVFKGMVKSVDDSV